VTDALTAQVRSPESLSRSRSRGGSEVGSSDHPGRRNPRATGQSLNAEFLATARATLLTQRSFRVQQLQELGTVTAHAEDDAARREVRVRLRAAAKSALRDIDGALRRIKGGHYGRCPACGDALSMERLRALPMTRLCGRCHRATAERPADSAAA
jgi:DnaK suppressor protein